MFDLIIHYISFGKVYFLLFFAALLSLYLAWKALVLCSAVFLFGQPDRLSDLKAIGRITVAFVCSMLLFFFLMGFALERVATAHAPELVAVANDRMMALDWAIFGMIPFAWIQDATNPAKPVFDALAGTFVNVYFSLSFALGAVMALTLFKGGRMFHRFVLSFAFSFLMSVPLWYFIPAVSPIDGYLDNVTGAPVPEYVRASLASYEPNPVIRGTFDVWRTLRSRHLADGVFATTTMPSMHVAWATLVLSFGVAVWAPLAVIVIPYFILNLVSTVYLAQHYAVDAVAGIVVAGIAIALGGAIARRWTPKAITNLHDFIRTDLLVGVSFLKRAYNRMV